MKSLLKKILIIIRKPRTHVMFIALFLSIPAFASAFFYPTGGQTYYLEGGISQAATTIFLSSFTEPNSGVPYTMPYLNSNIEYATIDPLVPNRSEFISFTGIIQNADGSAILTGVTRGLTGSYPYTSSTTIEYTHAAQAQFILSDSPQLFTQYAAKQNNEVVTGNWSFPSPVSSSSPATEGYVLSTVSGTSTLAFNKTVVAGNASGTVATGSIVFFNNSNAEWASANSASSTNIYNTIFGIAQGAGTDGNAINGGVLVKGLDSNQTGLTSGLTYYLSSTTAGSITSSKTAWAVGAAYNTTSIYFDPYFDNAAFLGNANTFTGINTFTGSTTLSASTTFIGTSIATTTLYTIGKNFIIATTTGTSTLTLPAGISPIFVRIVGGGAGGGNGTSNESGGGGGAGACVESTLITTGITNVQIYVGAGSTANTPTTQKNTTFTYFNGVSTTTLTAQGGTEGNSNTTASAGGVGGYATGGNVLNINGGEGSYGIFSSVALPGFGGTSCMGGPGTTGVMGAPGSGGQGGFNGNSEYAGVAGMVEVNW